MIKILLDVLKCPICTDYEKLLFEKRRGNKNLDGTFYCKNNHKFYCQNSIVDFIDKTDYTSMHGKFSILYDKFSNHYKNNYKKFYENSNSMI